MFAMRLRPALFLVMALLVLGAFAVAGFLTQRQLSSALLESTRAELESAGMLLHDRWEATSGMRMMHAKELAEAPALAEAISAGDVSGAVGGLASAAEAWGEFPVLVDAGGAPMADGIPVPTPLVEATRTGQMPVTVVEAEDGLHLLALAPVMMDGEWVAAAGSSTPFDASEAGTLAGLTHAGVSFVHGEGGPVVATTTLDATTAETLARAMMGSELDSVSTVMVDDEAYYALAGQFQPGLRIVFARSLSQELAVLPELQRTALLAGAGALVVALLAAALFSGLVSRPVGALASAADRLAAGVFEAPVPDSAIAEVSRMADAFKSMRESLIRRLAELEEANAELEDRQERLVLLQAELVQRERAASAGQLAVQLAHEIRNPIASVRNCLEIMKRRSASDEEASAFADLAIDELLRLHEMAENMLSLQRARPGGDAVCDATRTAMEIAALSNAGSGPEEPGRVSVVGLAPPRVGIAADALKQVLLNLVFNAREAEPDTGVEVVLSESAGEAVIEVLDRGPGISEEDMPRIFDPFFSTKEEVRGVGLGLFMADAMIRSHRGSITAENRADGPGARFVIRLPAKASEADIQPGSGT